MTRAGGAAGPARRLEGGVVVVTGAAGDIGAAIARRASAEGATLALLDLSAPDALAAELPSAIAIAADVSDEQACRAAVALTVERLGPPTGLVNNAAVVTPSATVVDLPVEEWRRALDVNLTGAMLMSRAAIPHMVARGGGVIVHVASQLGQVAAAGRAAYGATKAALIHLAKSMTLDHARDGVRVASLSPGPVMTGRLVARYGGEEQVAAALAPKCPVGRVGAPEEIAAAAVFLLSADAAFLAGADLLVDGGYAAA